MFVVVAVGAFLAYFVGHTAPNGEAQDFFNRTIYPAPLYLSIAGIEHWRGLFWFIIDGVLFWGGLGLGAALYSYGSQPSKR